MGHSGRAPRREKASALRRSNNAGVARVVVAASRLSFDPAVRGAWPCCWFAPPAQSLQYDAPEAKPMWRERRARLELTPRAGAVLSRERDSAAAPSWRAPRLSAAPRRPAHYTCCPPVGGRRVNCVTARRRLRTCTVQAECHSEQNKRASHCFAVRPNARRRDPSVQLTQHLGAVTHRGQQVGDGGLRAREPTRLLPTDVCARAAPAKRRQNRTAAGRGARLSGFPACSPGRGARDAPRRVREGNFSKCLLRFFGHRGGGTGPRHAGAGPNERRRHAWPSDA